MMPRGDDGCCLFRFLNTAWSAWYCMRGMGCVVLQASYGMGGMGCVVWSEWLHCSTNLKAVLLLSCGLGCFAVLSDRWQVILGESPGRCTQCNSLARF